MKKAILLVAALVSSGFLYAEKIKFNARRMSGTAGDKNSTTILQGNANVITKNMEINADFIELSGKDFRYIKARGSIHGINTKSNLDFTCENLFYDRETEIATLENNVVMKDTENDVEAKAQIIEYDQDTEIAIMQIQINLTQKDNVCTSSYAIYRKNEQILEMSGNPKIVQKGDTFRAQTITLDMDTQEITLSGRVKGSVVTENGSDDDEEENSEGEEIAEGEESAGEEGSAEEGAKSETSDETDGSGIPDSPEIAETIPTTAGENQ